MADFLDLPPRGEFPPHWGEPPTPGDSPERRRWIAEHARRDGGRRGRNPIACRLYLLEIREDAAMRREAARITTRNRMRREYLQLLADCP